MSSKSSASAAAANMEWDINDSNIPKVRTSISNNSYVILKSRQLVRNTRKRILKSGLN